MPGLAGLRVGLLERRHPPGHLGSITLDLVPLLRACDAVVDVVHAEEGGHRVDVDPPWDLVILKAGSAAALHLAAVAEAHGTPCTNSSDATGLARDKLASTAILRSAGVPVPRSLLVWLGGALDDGSSGGDGPPAAARWEELVEATWAVKSARGWHGKGVWVTEGADLATLVANLPDGPYLFMEHVDHVGEDLKVFIAGDWAAAIERPFPAITLAQKRGRPAGLPADVLAAAREVGRLLGLTCFGCDFIRGSEGWVLVDVNAFPGYKGALGAAEAIVAEVARTAGGPRG